MVDIIVFIIIIWSIVGSASFFSNFEEKDVLKFNLKQKIWTVIVFGPFVALIMAYYIVMDVHNIVMDKLKD